MRFFLPDPVPNRGAQNPPDPVLEPDSGTGLFWIPIFSGYSGISGSCLFCVMIYVFYLESDDNKQWNLASKRKRITFNIPSFIVYQLI